MYSICGRQALLPKSLVIPPCYDPTGNPQGHGGFSDVWKGRHQGQDVAAKVLKVYVKDGFTMVKKVGCRWDPRLVTRTDELIIPRIEVLQGGCGMECPSPRACATTSRRDNDGDSIRDGVGVDGKRECQRVREGESQGGSVEACVFFVYGPYLRLSLTTT